MPNWKKIPETQGWVQRIGEWGVRQHTFMPRMIDLEVTRICNLKCPGCLRNAPSSLRWNGEKHCTLGRLRDLLEEIPDLSSFNFMGDGEPTCNPELQDLIKYLSSQNIYTIITTNGTRITEKVVREWVDNKIYRVHVSVDGATKKTYDEIRVGAEFGKTVENLKIIGKSGIPLCVNMLLSEDNINEMPQMVELCKDVGAREVTFLMPICTLGDDNGKGLVTRPMLIPENWRLFLETKKMCFYSGIKWVFPISLQPMFRRLSFAFARPQISIEGDVYSCCYMIGRGKTWFDGHLVDIPSKDYTFGNIFEKGFKEIWHSDDMNELRREIIRTERKRGTIITRDELRRMRENLPSGRFKHCEACLPRWGMACS